MRKDASNPNQTFAELRVGYRIAKGSSEASRTQMRVWPTN